MPTMPGFKKSAQTEKKKAFSGKREFYTTEYNTTAWRKLREARLRRDPICQGCKRAMANVLDHIKPVRLGGEFWNEENHQPLCDKCHNSKSAKERFMK
jgi:5-methylcytosine-specific restriction endonuclease McrA